jgi:hypothetical protein
MKTLSATLLTAALAMSWSNGVHADAALNTDISFIQSGVFVDSCDGCFAYVSIQRGAVTGQPPVYYVYANMIGSPYIWYWEAIGRISTPDEFFITPTKARVSAKFTATWGPMAGSEFTWTADCTTDTSDQSATRQIYNSRIWGGTVNANAHMVTTNTPMRCAVTLTGPGISASGSGLNGSSGGTSTTNIPH